MDKASKVVLVSVAFLFILFVAIAIFLCQPRNSSPWSQMAVNDLAITKQLISENSPQTQHADSMYAVWLDAGYKKSLAMAKEINSFPGYISVMRYYLSGFRDFHSDLVPLLKIINPSDKWPGFIVGMRNNKVEVTYQATDANQWSDIPKVGAQLISCDGQSVEQLIKTHIVPFYGVNPDYPSTWNEYIPRLLVWDQNPFVKQIKSCIFSFNNHRETYDLHWQVVENPSPLSLGEKNFQQALADAAFGETPLFNITQFAPGAVWISVPIFAWGLPTQGTTTTELLKEVASQVGKLRDKKLLVFDVRGNTGGDPKSMMPIILNLYGADYLRSLGNAFEWNKPQKIEFRVTQKNLDHMIETQSPKAMIDGMKTALARHQKLFVYQYLILPPGNAVSQNPVKAKVVLVTDGRCGSECDSFVMAMKSIPGVIQVGQPTAPVATSTWNDVFVFKDNAAAIVYPTGLIQSSKIKDGAPIFPKYYYQSYMGSTQDLQNWIWSLYKTGKLDRNSIN